MAQELLEFKPTPLKRLGLDEIALLKGKGNYCAVLNLDKSKLVAILQNGHKKKLPKPDWVGLGSIRANRRSEH